MVIAKLIRRYKRFLADVEMPDGEVITVHTPNTGSMMGCSEPGSRVALREVNNPKRKYRYSWEMTENADGTWIGVNTGAVNQMVKQAIEAGVITELQGYANIRSEVRYGNENSRIDLLLEQGPDGKHCYVENKNVTARDENGLAIFPDAVSARGTKHLRELMAMVEEGHRAVIFYCVQRGDVTGLRPADEIDPLYGRTLREAVDNGVEALAYRADVSPDRVQLGTAIPVNLR